ncbi:hypothetical protein QZH41_005090 [Actinostola sp. cb2023]|nr:hypothetical protein QZH41_005090 [Actinostola sp. cb2023]
MSDITEVDVARLIQQNNEQLLASMQTMMDRSVSELKRSSTETSESHLKEIKKLKYDEPHKFKKKANEDQFKFNIKVMDTISDAKQSLEKNDQAKAKEELSKGDKLMSERQNDILLADKSEFGWATVNEYKKHELAEDSDDEKRIYKSELRVKAQKKQALAKIPKRHQKRQSEDSNSSHSIPVVVNRQTQTYAVRLMPIVP